MAFRGCVEGFVRPVKADEVELGAPLAWSVYDGAGKLLFVQGMVVACQAHLDILLERGMVVPETSTSGGTLLPAIGKGEGIAPSGGVEPPARAETENAAPEADAISEPEDAADGEEEQLDDEAEPEAPLEPLPSHPPVFPAIQQLRRVLQALHAELLDCPFHGFDERVRDLAMRLQVLVARDQDAALAAMQLEVGEDDQSARLMHAAILCQVLLQARQWDEEESISVVAAALTFDVALGPIVAELNQQPGGLTVAQRLVIDGHPQAGVELLQNAGVDDPVWLEAVLHHHERLDGSGYPNRLTADAITAGARTLAIVDIYSAMVRPRAYREAIHARHALRNLFMERGKAVDEALATLLIREIGVFPPGTPVRLANGEVGVVLHRGRDAAKPVVARLINANGTLAAIAAQRDTSTPAYAITETVPPNKYQALVSSAGELWDKRTPPMARPRRT
ncbi:HD-GYP domain, c-di-GMP phosphodiesterase class II (or its inactivated variant) [Lysobacter spongiicola DSM 21749]|uniref:HD-GYP domain, c-di-GMP phosphodiesterase class II (Or its inactivated variant) n=1 Tax=Lysobacter spongiicola DSM 21749 TaxID=1122188 RepID=A0A1T4QPL5_9GAMM|nr:HD-GYP domain, c-di-GMP phosphodiesterase class II (or its inactivated variant) [Lysobacter spongiicola DSM 21749]